MCLSVREHISGTTRPIFISVHVTYGRRPSYTDGVVISALRMTSCLHTMAREDDAKRAYTKSDSTGGSTDLTRQRTNKLTQQRTGDKV